MTRRQELAAFMTERGFCWLDFGKYRQAVECFAWAAELVPDNRRYLDQTQHFAEIWRADLLQREYQFAPGLSVEYPGRVFQNVPAAFEHFLVRLRVGEMQQSDPTMSKNWWEPQRQQPGIMPKRTPKHLCVAFKSTPRFDNRDL